MLGWIKRLFQRPRELSVAESYDLWAPDYPPHAHNPLMELEENAFLDMLPGIPGLPALDLACGSGRYLKRLLLRGASPVVGPDASTPMLARARSITSNLINGDLLSLGLRSGAFSVVTCALALGHVKDLHQAMREISRVIAPGGTLVYSDFHPFGSLLGWKRIFRGPDGREYAVRHFTHLFSDHVAACAAAGFHIEELREPQISFEHKWRGYPALLVIRAKKTR